MKSFLTLGQIISAVLLICAILLQSQDEGLSFSSGGGTYRRSRRGVEKMLFYFTIFLAVMFLALSFLGVAIS